MAAMKTFIMPEVGKTDVVDKPIPEPGPNDVVVKTTHALICTSDVHTVRGALPVEDGVTLGHEAAGTIHAIGSNVNGFTEGQRVAVNAVTPCYRCRYCQSGYTSQCQGPLGGYRYTPQMDGNMAEYFLVPYAEPNLALIPEDISSEAAVYACDMLSTGFMGAENCHLRIGDTAAVFAQGSVGLSATIGLRLQGASRIFAVEAVPERQDLARQYGASDIIDFTHGDAVEQIMDATDGEGVDAAVEALGQPATWESCLRATKAGGRISNVGYHGEHPEPLQVPLDAFGLGMAAKSIHSGLCPGGNDRMQRLFAMIRTELFDPKLMTTHTFGFDDIQTAFRMMENKEDHIIKPLITF